jgi:hypothetical protein
MTPATNDDVMSGGLGASGRVTPQQFTETKSATPG